MNNYEKAIQKGIEEGLNNHFSKKEPKKIWLTVEEAKQLVKGCSSLCGLFHALNLSDNFNEMIKLTIKINNQIEQAEKDEFPYYKNIQEIADYIKRNKKQ